MKNKIFTDEIFSRNQKASEPQTKSQKRIILNQTIEKYSSQ